jgi:hypothetical protein
MGTPEEELAAMKLQVEEFKAKGAEVEALNARVSALAAENAKMAEESKKKDLDMAMTQSLAEFPEAKEMKEFIRGSTPDEIKASAKAMHEKISANRKSFYEKHNIKPSDDLNAWGGVPGSTPPEFMIDPNRAEKIKAVRDSNMPKRMKIAEMMKMKIEDLHKNFAVGARRALGLR